MNVFLNRLICGLAFFMSVPNLLAQTLPFNIGSFPRKDQPDSLSVNAFRMADRDPDSALWLARTGVDMALKAHDKWDEGCCLNSLGWAYFRLGRYDTAEVLLNRAISIFHELNIPREEARCHINIAVLYQTREWYEKALRALTIANEMSKGDWSSQVSIDRMMGIIYRRLGDHAKARQHLEEAVAKFQPSGRRGLLADALSSLGAVHVDQHSLDTALILYKQALVIYKEVNNLNGLAFTCEGIGGIYATMSTERGHSLLDSSLRYYKKALALFEQYGNPQDAAFEKMSIGNVLVDHKMYREAAPYFEEAMVGFRSSHTINYQYQALVSLSRLNENTGNYRQAYSYLVEANALEDSIDADNREKEMSSMLAKYETDRKDNTIKLLNARNQLAENNLNRRRIVELFSLAVVILLIVLGITLVNRYRIKMKLKNVQMRNQFASDLHDDVGSSLSSILLLSKMGATNMAAASTAHHEIFEKINTNALEVIDKMSDIVWTTNPRFDEGGNLRERMENYLAAVRQSKPLDFTVNISEQIDLIRFTMEVRKSIFLIFKEAIHNIWKHSEATAVEIEFGLIKGSLKLTIRDNGRGFDSSQSSKGMGLETMKQRAKTVKGTLTVTSHPGSGTEITVVMPNPGT